MEKIFFVKFPKPVLPFIPADISICCITNDQNPEAFVEAEPDRIYIWQDIQLAKTLSLEPALNGRIWLALPINLSHTPYNIEYLQYKIATGHDWLAEDRPAALTQAREKQLRQLALIYDEIDKKLQELLVIKKDRIAILLDGDETFEEKDKIIRLAKNENPFAKFTIVQIDKLYEQHAYKRTLKFFPKHDIFEYEKVYTVKSVMAFYLFLFCETLIFGKERLERKKIFTDNSFHPVLVKFINFYFEVCKNTHLANMDSLLADIFEPFAQLLIHDKRLKRTNLLTFLNSLRLGKDFSPIEYLPEMVKKYYLKKYLKNIIKKELSIGQRHNIYSRSLLTKLQLIQNKNLNFSLLCESQALKIISTAKTRKERLKILEQAANTGKSQLAIALGLLMLEMGQISPKVLRLIIFACINLGEFQTASHICKLAIFLFGDWNNGEFKFTCLRLMLFENRYIDAFTALAFFIFSHNRGNLNLSRFRVNQKLKRVFGNFNWDLVLALLKLKNVQRACFEKAKLLYAIKNYSKAAEILENLSHTPPARLLFQIYMDTNQYENAERILKTRLKNDKKNAQCELLYHLHKGDREGIKKILAETDKMSKVTNLNLSYMAHLATGELNRGFKIFAENRQFHVLDKYFPRQIATELKPDLKRVEKAVVFSECYPGDELRYSRLYPLIASKINAEKCVFTCDYRFEKLFRRTFPELEFFPVKKIREIDLAGNLNDFMGLPGMELSRYMDKKTWEKFKDYDRVTSVIPALGSVLTSYDQLKNLRKIEYDRLLRDRIRKLLEQERDKRGLKYIAGLSWRSMLSDKHRELNFVNFNMVNNLLKIPEILWISCQYDDLTPIEHEYFSNFKNFIFVEDMDQMEDIDSAASLYGALDLVISAPTLVADLAAAIGKPTIVPVSTFERNALCAPGYDNSIFDSAYKIFKHDGFGNLETMIHKHIAIAFHPD